jgi:hypothetical protein
VTFDSRRWIEAHQPPVFVDVDGRTFTGRLWSHLEYEKWMKVFRDWLTAGSDADDYETKLRELVASMGFSADATNRMLQLPDGAFIELMNSFFVLQRAGRLAPSTPDTRPPLPPSPTTAPASPPSAS